MPSPLTIHGLPERVRRPVLLMAFGGWNDASESATMAARHLARAWSAEPFATIDPEEFYHFGLTRPHIRFKEGSRTEREIIWPATEFSAAALPELDRDVIIGLAVEPHLKWQTYCGLVLEFARRCNVSLVLTLGALHEERRDRGLRQKTGGEKPRRRRTGLLPQRGTPARLRRRRRDRAVPPAAAPRGGHGLAPWRGSPLAEESLALAGLTSASVQGRVALGRRAGARVLRLGGEPNTLWVTCTGPRQAHLEGFDLHANLLVPAEDRPRLEQLCRYLLRPPVAQDRLRLTGDGRVLLELKSAWHDGTSHLLFEPLELLEKLAALTPRPRVNLVLYHGVLAPHARWRPRAVAYEGPKTPLRETRAVASGAPRVAQFQAEAPGTRRSWAWADLMRRAFEFDVLACPRCGGRMRLIATIEDPRVIRRILAHLGLPTEPSDPCPFRSPPGRTAEIVSDIPASPRPMAPALGRALSTKRGIPPAERGHRLGQPTHAQRDAPTRRHPFHLDSLFIRAVPEGRLPEGRLQGGASSGSSSGRWPSLVGPFSPRMPFMFPTVSAL